MAYHHGNLRRAILDGAVAAIEADGVAALSLRDVARRAGVSHAAPAHHFGDKAGVLTTIATEGYERLAEATRSALAGGEFVDGGLAYIRFAIEHPAHFEVMFRPEVVRAGDPDLVAARYAAADVLFDAVRARLGEDARDEDVFGGLAAVWSFCHGLATLWLNGNFAARRGDDPEAVARAAVGGAARLAEAGAFPVP